MTLCHVSAPTRAESHNTETNRNRRSCSLQKEYCSCLSRRRKGKNTSQKQKRRLSLCLVYRLSFPGGSDGKESACNVGDPGSIPASGRSPGVVAWLPLQYSCLENSVDRAAWWATAHGITESDGTERLTLSDFYFQFTFRVLSFWAFSPFLTLSAQGNQKRGINWQSLSAR